jgi:solute carrier family 50 protein (sugar transporter)
MGKLVLAVNVGFLAVVVAVALLALHGGARLDAVGLLCAAITIGMYAAPLGSMVSILY